MSLAHGAMGGSVVCDCEMFSIYCLHRLAPVLKTIFHQCVILYTCSQSYSDGSVLKQSHQSVADTGDKDWSQSTVYTNFQTIFHCLSEIIGMNRFGISG